MSEYRTLLHMLSQLNKTEKWGKRGRERNGNQKKKNLKEKKGKRTKIDQIKKKEKRWGTDAQENIRHMQYMIILL